MGASESRSVSDSKSSKSKSARSLKKPSQSKSSTSNSSKSSKSKSSTSNSSKSSQSKSSTSDSSKSSKSNSSASNSSKSSASKSSESSKKKQKHDSALPQYLQFRDDVQPGDASEVQPATEVLDATEATETVIPENVFEDKLLKYLSSDREWLEDDNVNITPSDIEQLLDETRVLSLNDLSEKGKKEFDEWYFIFTDRDAFYSHFFSFNSSQEDDQKAALQQILTEHTDNKQEEKKDVDTVQKSDDQLQSLVNQIYEKQQEQMMKKNLPLRLRLSELSMLKGRNRPFQIIGHWFGRIGQNVNLFSGIYGTVHASLAIGSYIVDWDAGEIIWPSIFIDEALCEIDISQNAPWWKQSATYSAAAITSVIGAALIGPILAGMRLKEGGTLTDAADAFKTVFNNIWSYWTRSMIDLSETRRERLKELATLCVNWNKYGRYSVQTCNCQQFVDQALYALDVDVTFEGNLKTFIDQIRTTGNGAMIWGDKIIESRKELDDIIRDNWKGGNKSDKQLLTSYAYMMETRRKIAIENDDEIACTKYTTDLTDEFRKRQNIPPNPLHEQYNI